MLMADDTIVIIVIILYILKLWLVLASITYYLTKLNLSFQSKT